MSADNQYNFAVSSPVISRRTRRYIGDQNREERTLPQRGSPSYDGRSRLRKKYLLSARRSLNLFRNVERVRSSDSIIRKSTDTSLPNVHKQNIEINRTTPRNFTSDKLILKPVELEKCPPSLSHLESTIFMQNIRDVSSRNAQSSIVSHRRTSEKLNATLSNFEDCDACIEEYCSQESVTVAASNCGSIVDIQSSCSTSSNCTGSKCHRTASSCVCQCSEAAPVVGDCCETATAAFCLTESAPAVSCYNAMQCHVSSGEVRSSDGPGESDKFSTDAAGDHRRRATRRQLFVSADSGTPAAATHGPRFQQHGDHPTIQSSLPEISQYVGGAAGDVTVNELSADMCSVSAAAESVSGAASIPDRVEVIVRSTTECGDNAVSSHINQQCLHLRQQWMSSVLSARDSAPLPNSSWLASDWINQLPHCCTPQKNANEHYQPANPVSTSKATNKKTGLSGQLIRLRKRVASESRIRRHMFSVRSTDQSETLSTGESQSATDTFDESQSALRVYVVDIRRCAELVLLKTSAGDGASVLVTVAQNAADIYSAGCTILVEKPWFCPAQSSARACRLLLPVSAPRVLFSSEPGLVHQPPVCCSRPRC